MKMELLHVADIKGIIGAVKKKSLCTSTSLLEGQSTSKTEAHVLPLTCGALYSSPLF